MILPGISGSFILLLLGKYRQILNAVVAKDFFTLIIFTTGCVLGISLFSRFLSWLFKRYHDISVAILAGFMLGSVRKIWPWQIQESLILPNQFDGSVLFVLVLIILGFVVVFGLDRLKLVKEQKKDVAV
jgi:putative membrane protein